MLILNKICQITYSSVMCGIRITENNRRNYGVTLWWTEEDITNIINLLNDLY